MSTINLHNYETWLMLYLDNELTAAEREAVAAFISAHPDVQEELNGLKETLLQQELPEAMPGRERLLMPEVWNEEALTPQQEQLLMLADKELAADAKEALQAAIAQSPLLQKEWMMLQAAVLPSQQPVTMAHKERLYRRQAARVIPMARLLRYAAAAAVLFLGWFALDQAVGLRQKDSSVGQVVTATGRQSAANPAPRARHQTAREVIPANANGGDAASEQLSKTQRKAEYDSNINTTTVLRHAPEEVPVLAKSEQQDELPVLQNNRDITGKIATVNYVDVEGVDETPAPPVGNATYIRMAFVQQEAKPTAVQEVVYAEDLVEDESISIAGAHISKQKIRSLYRNITRPLARSFEKNQGPRTEVK